MLIRTLSLGLFLRIVQAAVNVTTQISDGKTAKDQLRYGEAATYTFQPALSGKNTSASLYITLNICSQPWSLVNASDATSQVYPLLNPPKLYLYSALDNSTQTPNSTFSRDFTLSQWGFANLTYPQNGSRVYVSVQAPPRSSTSAWSNDTFTYSIGISTTSPIHRAYSGLQNRFLFLQDSDYQAALLTTGNLTGAMASSQMPNFDLWINPSSPNATSINVAASIQSALRWSWCGLTTTPSAHSLKDADRSMTTRGPGGLPKEQFYMHSLDPGTWYDAYLTLQTTDTDGGTVWPVQQLRTRDASHCQIISDLDFCSEVAYAVPSNATLYNPVALGQWYDTQASELYDNFTKSLQVLNCNSTPDATYSLVSTCDDCKDAYKDWLCAVAIPRCADLTNPATFLRLRNGTSRLPTIEEHLAPGAYKEVLPCIDLVDTMTAKCPINGLGFRVPAGHEFRQWAYADRSNNETITCNAPGVNFWVARASTVKPSRFLPSTGLLVALALAFS
ncbi:stretch-activated cation channel mid1 [Savitreella phatthalungensis]